MHEIHNNGAYRLEVDVDRNTPRTITFYSTVFPPWSKEPERRVAYKLHLTTDEIVKLGDVLWHARRES